MAAICAGSPPAVVPGEPQAEFIRAYHYDLVSPVRLALDGTGSVYVADPRQGLVAVRGADGRMLHVQSLPGRPGAVAVDAAGRVYLADLDNGLISVYDGDWRLLLQFGGADLVRPGDMAIDEGRNRLYVSDSEAHTVRVFSTAGQLLFSFGSEGTGDGQLLYPTGLFYDPLQDEILVSDQLGYRIQVFTPDGEWRYCFGGSSGNPGSFFQGGRLFAAPQGLWADPEGRVYVADSYEGRIKVVDRSGRLLGSIGSFGSAGGELRIPSDLVLDGFGRLFVASTNNARLEIFGVDGFTDPERFAPALVEADPRLLQAGEGGILSLRIRVPGHRLSDIQPDTIRANGLPPLSLQSGDLDRDGKQELHATFDRGAVLGTLPGAGPGEIQLRGALPNLTIDGRAMVDVIPQGPVDEDLDGVPDEMDACQGSTADAVVDAQGCSIDQRCSCAEARTHGRHVRCVAKTSRAFLQAGLIDREQRQEVLREAARSVCGRRQESDREDWREHNRELHGKAHEVDQRKRQGHVLKEGKK